MREVEYGIREMYSLWTALQARIEATDDDSGDLRALLDQEVDLGNSILEVQPKTAGETAIQLVVEAVNGLIDIDHRLLCKYRSLAAGRRATGCANFFWERLSVGPYSGPDLKFM